MNPKQRSYCFGIVILILLGSSNFILGQEQTFPDYRALRREALESVETAKQIASHSVPFPMMDKSKHPRFWESYEDYWIKALHHRSESFEWQLKASRIIFWTVILLIFVGMYMSYRQFETASKGPPQTFGDLHDVSRDPTTIRLNPGGIEITSSVVGVVILVLSLGFFFLYLKFVFPINIVGSL